MPCAGGCGRLLWRGGKGDLPAGEKTCRECRRSQKCSEPDCDRHPEARGLCRTHYGQAVAERRFGNPECSVPNCTRGANAHDLCGVHNVARRRAEGYKEPPRKKREHVCEHCSTTFVGDQGSRSCQSCARERRTARILEMNAARRVEPPPPSSPVYYFTCSTCERVFAARTAQRRLYCSTPCSYERRLTHPRQCRDCGEPLGMGTWQRRCSPCHKTHRKLVRRRHKRGGTHRRRARRKGVPHQEINKKAIFERDRWRCGICRRKVYQHLTWPHPGCAVLDHIVPLATPGTPGHVPANVQCAHNRCNAAKSDSLGAGVQPALF